MSEPHYTNPYGHSDDNGRGGRLQILHHLPPTVLYIVVRFLLRAIDVFLLQPIDVFLLPPIDFLRLPVSKTRRLAAVSSTWAVDLFLLSSPSLSAGSVAFLFSAFIAGASWTCWNSGSRVGPSTVRAMASRVLVSILKVASSSY